VRALVLAVLLVACGATPVAITPTPAPTREPRTLSVSVLLDLSGPRAPSGQPQRDAMQRWLDQHASADVRIKAKFVDLAGSEARALLELRRAVLEDHADAVIMGVPVALDDAFARAAQVAEVPLLLTLPAAEPAATVGGRWVFVLAPTPDVLARGTVDDIQSRGILAPLLLASDDTTAGAIESGAVLAELARRQLQQPTVLSVIRPDGVARMRAAAAVARSVVLTGAAASYTAFIRGTPPNATSPRMYLSYLTENADVTNVRDQSALVTWPGTRKIASLPTTMSTIAGTAYDALGLLESAASLAPNELDASRLRPRLETLTFAGVVTTYRFTFTRHAGFASEDLAFLRWNAQRNAPMVITTETREAPQ
jgi:hypothetical protein